MKLESNDLEFIFGRIIQFLKHYGDIIIIDEDYYWEIDESEKYIVKNKPTISAIGSLHDDITNLLKLLDKNRIVTPVDLDRLAAILSKVSNSISSDRL